jgi:D-alanyl-D-alanine carboxypeptidase (penicillin-binding protein 5/6)
MQHEIFRKIVGTKVWNASREGADSYNYFYNKNKTIFQYEGATGIKIGYTTTSGRCLVASAQKNGMELIAVVLNDTNWFEDAYSLFDYGFACYNNVTVCEAEKRLTTVKVSNGSRNKVFVGTHDAVICPSIKGEKTDISVEYEIPQQTDAPVSRWQEAGSMKIFSAGEYIYAVPLYYLEDID